uniref:polynucleotide adenylyltransferase n=1 Tax=Globodera rostochiensis TaxID=31243 RepID=A0A914HKH2_GLORO
MMKIQFLLILHLQFDQIIAAPGTGIAKIIAAPGKGIETICSWYNTFRFVYYPINGIQHILLDNLYMDYFLDNSATDQRIIMQKIAIYTHIYMMRWTIEQNVGKLCKMRAFRPTDGYNAEAGAGGTSNNAGQSAYDKMHQKFTKWGQKCKMFTFQPVADGHADGDGAGGTSNKTGQNAYEWLCQEMKIIFSLIDADDKTPEAIGDLMHFPSSLTMCYFLKFKFELSHMLSATNFGIFPNENVSCKSVENIRQSVEMNLEPIREWMLSDLVHFFKRRPKLVKYFDKLHKRNNESEIVENRQKFVALFGIARTALLYDVHFENFGFFALINEKNNSNTLLYKEFFKQNNKLGKWRTKILLDKYLYSEWFITFYNNEMKAALEGGQRGEKLHTMAILADLHCFWDCFSNDFWLNEKNIRQAIGQFVKKNGGKMSKLKQPFLVQCQPSDWVNCQQNETDLPTLWENGPEDVSLFRALTICTKEIINEQKVNNKQAKSVEIDDNFLSITNFKFLQCVEKGLKNNARRDNILSKLHFEKIEELLEYEHYAGFIGFKTLLSENKRSLKELLDSEGFKKVDELLKKNFEYFSPGKKKAKFGTKGRSNSGKSFELRRVSSEGQLNASTRRRVSSEGQLIDNTRGQLIDSPSPPRGQLSDSSRRRLVDIPRGPSERQLGNSPSPKGQIEFDPSSPKRQLDFSSPTYYTCVTMLKQIGIEKFSDLLKDFLLGNFYKKYLENKFDEKCVVYLHISMFVRTIEAKLKTKTTNFEKNAKWKSFKDKTFVEEPQFLAEKLFVVQSNLDELSAFGTSTSTDCLEKAMEMLNNVKMRRVGKDIEDDQFENILPLINDQNDDDDDVIRITQFGSYKMETFKNVLIQLHNHVVAFLCAKKFAEIPSENEQNATLLNLEKLNFIFNAREMLLKKVGAMNIMLTQQQIGNPIICESSQYNLIRTNPANRQNDDHLSNGIVQFITLFCAGEEKNSMIDQIKWQIALALKKWVQKVANFEQPLLLTSGSHLMGSNLDSSDLDLLCVVPDQINLFTFYGENDTTLYSTLRKELFGAKLSWIAGKVPLIQIKFGQIELDLLLVPVPIKYLTGRTAAAKLESDQVIKDIGNVKGIYSLAGYRSGKFQLSLVNDKQLFAYFLKSIKVWAKNRLIYSGIFGYFNGATLSVMVTKICALFPFAPLAYLLYQFFQIYSKWNWPVDPVLLDKLSTDSLNVLVNGWPPKFGENSMTVITPKFPEQNAAFNVNKFTLRTIVEEINSANQILSENGQKWAQIFEEVKYAEKFAHFAIILCADVDAQRHATNCGFYRSKIRRNLFEWATATNVLPMLAHYQIIPQSEEKTICNISNFVANCTFWMSSSYTNAEKLSNTLNELHASTAASS